MPKTQPFRFIAYFLVLPIFCGSCLAAIYNFVIIPSSTKPDSDYYNLLFIMLIILAAAAVLSIIFALLCLSWRVRPKAKYFLEFFLFISISIICFFAFVALLIDPTTIFLGQKFPSKRKYPAKQAIPVVINNIRVLDTDNRTVLEGRRVLISGGKIEGIGSAEEIPIPPGADIIEGEGKTLLPGLIDGHVHLGLSGKLEGLYRPFFVEPLAKSMERNARLTIESGVTTVREMPDYYNSSFVLKKEIDQGRINGPKIIASGRAITQIGGYYGWPAFGLLLRAPNDVDTAINYNLQEGAGFIFVPTPDSTILRTGERDISEDMLQAAAEYARSKDINITAHTMWSNGATLAVEKGISGLEHMPSIMDPLKKNLVDQILRDGIYVVPTAFMYNNLNQITFDPQIIENPEYKERFGPSYKIARGYAQELNEATFSEDAKERESTEILDKAVSKYFQKNFAQLMDAGVTIGVGTGAGELLMPHGWINKELETYVNYGMSPMEAIVAATYTNAFIINKEDKIGRIKPGFTADLLIVEGDPTVNIQDIKNVKMVFKDGVIVYEK